MNESNMHYAVDAGAGNMQLLPSDEDDLQLFGSSRISDAMSRKIISIKHDDPNEKHLWIASHLNGCVHRLGYILGQNTQIQSVIFRNCEYNLDVIGLCDGLQYNRSIEKFCLHDVSIAHPQKMTSLSPFVSQNPCLKMLTLGRCGVDGISGVHILSSAISSGADTLESLDLHGNHWGDISLDSLVQSLRSRSNFRSLNLDSNGLSMRACVSLAQLLQNENSNFESLSLKYNSINEDCSVVLANSLTRNTKLSTLDLSGNKMTSEGGWLTMLKLVYNKSSIADIMMSNHTLTNLGLLSSSRESQNPGTDNTSLLAEALQFNAKNVDIGSIRGKIMSYLADAQGKVSIGHSSLAVSAIPIILEWSSEYFRRKKLDVYYRVLLSKPDLLSHLSSTSGSKRRALEMMDLDEDSDQYWEVKRHKA